MPSSSYMNMTKSANILASLSETTEPCDDFFEFACENWIKAYPMPKGKLTIISATIIIIMNFPLVRNRNWDSIGIWYWLGPGLIS